MYIYGLDLSMEQTGIAVLDEKGTPILITSIATNKKQSHGQRLYQIASELINLKTRYPPTVIAIERGFSRFNTSTQVIYRVHGIVNYIFHDIQQVYYPPKKVKECILNGTATKKAIQKKLEKDYKSYGISFANEDESDALAVAVTYLKKMIK